MAQSLEQALAENTAALIENTAAHLQLAKVAGASMKSGTTATASTAVEPTDEKPATGTAAAAAKKAAAEALAAKKAATAEAAAAKKAAGSKKPKVPELEAEVSEADLRTACRAYLNTDDEEEREAHKANVTSAFAHLGVKVLTEIEAEGRAQLAGYVAYWAAGLEVVFEDIDALLADAPDEADDDDMGI